MHMHTYVCAYVCRQKTLIIKVTLLMDIVSIEFTLYVIHVHAIFTTSPRLIPEGHNKSQSLDSRSVYKLDIAFGSV